MTRTGWDNTAWHHCDGVYDLYHLSGGHTGSYQIYGGKSPSFFYPYEDPFYLSDLYRNASMYLCYLRIIDKKK